ncbi:hypothetical protein VTN31DRAFT_4781 [Thermomyces dupontii]|uniref:uncharacterized protein n=1 Tax=Talaromyces thermophilus TaxID=28565 RepID=UPI00374382A9
MTSDNSFPVSIASLQFPSAALSVSQTLSSLKRSALSVTNRLRSIDADAHFVEHVAEYYDLPLVANERCGSWYIKPDRKACSVYFKSTDGHSGEWKFSTRRLNLQVLSVAREYGGCVIVDSTRRGKLMPDALSKTIPIWCAVLNRTLFPSESAFHAVQFPPNYLGSSEESQIEQRIDGFVEAFKDLKLDIEGLKQSLGKPIKIAWANQSYFHPADAAKGSDYQLFVLCSASKRVHGAEISEGGYIQGAGDDSEGWSHGLTPSVFWKNRDLLLSTEESHLPDLINELLREHGKSDTSTQATLIRPTANLYIGCSDALSSLAGVYDLVISCNGRPAEGGDPPTRLNLGCGSTKLGSRDLRVALEKVKSFADKHLLPYPSRSLLVVCETGKDLSVGTLLTIICLYYNDNGQFVGLQPDTPLNKQSIRQRLTWITTSKPDANPSRATLQSVNAFLLGR